MTWLKEELHGKLAGCLYFWETSRMTYNVWSFAPCARPSLDQVTEADLQAAFCSGEDDEKGHKTFGNKWSQSQASGPSSTAIWVQEGEVVLAKHVLRPSVIYILEMTKQEQYSLRVRYVEVGSEAGVR